MKVRITEAAPVNVRFIGRTGTVTNVLPNAVVISVDGHGPAILHRTWGTKRNPGTLQLEPVQ
jgi:hypothetical protein